MPGGMVARVVRESPGPSMEVRARGTRQASSVEGNAGRGGHRAQAFEEPLRGGPAGLPVIQPDLPVLERGGVADEKGGAIEKPQLGVGARVRGEGAAPYFGGVDGQ